jgi:hypothetical protein
MKFHNKKLDYFQPSSLSDTSVVDISNSDFEKIKNCLVENKIGKLNPQKMSFGYFTRYEWRGTSGIGKVSIETDISTDN